VTGQKDRSKRIVYHSRPLIWFSPAVLVVSAALLALSSQFSWLAIVGLLLAPSLILLWISYYPRTVVESGGLRLYFGIRSRTVPWNEIATIDTRRGTIEVGLDAEVIVVPVPAARGPLGRRYVTRVAKHIEATWLAETGRSSLAV